MLMILFSVRFQVRKLLSHITILFRMGMLVEWQREAMMQALADRVNEEAKKADKETEG